MANNKRSSKRTSHNRTLLFILLAALIVIAGGIFVFMKTRTTQSQHPSQAAVAVKAPASSNESMFGFDLQRTHFNHFEHILNTTNVSQLVPFWSATTSAYINSSPS